MGILINKTIPAFTLLESMVAMVVVMIVFSLTTITILNVSTSGVSKQKQYAIAQAKMLRNQTMKTQRFIDEEMSLGNVRINKSFEATATQQNLKKMMIEAFVGNKNVFTSKELIYVE